jgi:site-specific recombinase XerD
MVTLRAEATKTKGYSLFLDIYKHYKRKKIRLGLYVSKDYTQAKTKRPKIHQEDKHAWDLANKLKTEHQHKLDLEGTSFINEISENRNFVEFFKMKNKVKNNNSYTYALKKLIEYKGRKITFGQVDINFLNAFKSYLKRTKVTDNTSKIYLHRMRVIWGEAIRERLTTNNPFLSFTMPKTIKKNPVYLTINELEIFVKHDSNSYQETVKKAFLFSCYTGLRISDVTLLQWTNIIENNSFIELRQKKSKINMLRIPLHPTAQAILSTLPKVNDSDTVFGLLTHNNTRTILRTILKKTIPNKHITYHVARHTFATLLTTHGGDYYATQLLLGHSVQGVTAGYAQLTDIRKIEVINKIPEIRLKE